MGVDARHPIDIAFEEGLEGEPSRRPSSRPRVRDGNPARPSADAVHVYRAGVVHPTRPNDRRPRRALHLGGVYGVCSLRRVFSLDFQTGIRRLEARGLRLYPLGKVAAEAGGRRRWPWRCQLPGSVRDRRHDRAAIRVYGVCRTLDFRAGIFGPRSRSLSLGAVGRRRRRFSFFGYSATSAGDGGRQRTYA